MERPLGSEQKKLRKQSVKIASAGGQNKSGIGKETKSKERGRSAVQFRDPGIPVNRDTGIPEQEKGLRPPSEPTRLGEPEKRTRCATGCRLIGGSVSATATTGAAAGVADIGIPRVLEEPLANSLIRVACQAVT